MEARSSWDYFCEKTTPKNNKSGLQCGQNSIRKFLFKVKIKLRSCFRKVRTRAGYNNTVSYAFCRMCCCFVPNQLFSSFIPELHKIGVRGGLECQIECDNSRPPPHPNFVLLWQLAILENRTN